MGGRDNRTVRAGAQHKPPAAHRGTSSGLRRRLKATSALSRSLLLAAAAGAALAGCGGGANESTPPTSTNPSPGAQQPSAQHQSAVKPLTPEEMREYDANEGRCHDDGGRVSDVGTVGAYCAFPERSSDFHLVESSSGKEPSVETE